MTDAPDAADKVIFASRDAVREAEAVLHKWLDADGHNWGEFEAALDLVLSALAAAVASRRSSGDNNG